MRYATPGTSRAVHRLAIHDDIVVALALATWTPGRFNPNAKVPKVLQSMLGRPPKPRRAARRPGQSRSTSRNDSEAAFSLADTTPNRRLRAALLPGLRADVNCHTSIVAAIGVAGK